MHTIVLVFAPRIPTTTVQHVTLLCSVFFFLSKSVPGLHLLYLFQFNTNVVHTPPILSILGICFDPFLSCLSVTQCLPRTEEKNKKLHIYIAKFLLSKLVYFYHGIGFLFLWLNIVFHCWLINPYPLMVAKKRLLTL